MKFEGLESMKITAKEIYDWGQKVDSTMKLSELVRRLVLETTPQPLTCHIPTSYLSYRPKTPGKVSNEFATDWVPNGESYWDVSLGTEIRLIAEDSYQKRTQDTSISDIRNSAQYTFVTPSIWADKDAWTEEKNNENRWGKVVVLDATNLERWFQYSVATRVWFAKQIGRNIVGILTPEEWWENWTRATNPELITKLLVTRQYKESTDLIYKLENYDSTISIKGDDSDESVAFVIATLKEQPSSHQLYKTIILTKDVEVQSQRPSELIVLCDLKSCNEFQNVQDKNVKVIEAYHKGQRNVNASIELSRVPRGRFQNILEDMKIEEYQANQLVLKTGCSIPILRRNLSNAGTLIPNWCGDIDILEKLIPFALCGSWLKNHKSEKDFEIIAKVASLGDQELYNNFEKLLELEQSPVDKSIGSHGEIYLVVSQFDALSMSRNVMSVDQIDRFFKFAGSFFIDGTTSVEIPMKNSWDSEFNGNSEMVSKYISKGICETLCILAVYGNEFYGNKLKIDFQVKVNEIVSSVFQEMDRAKWLSIQDYLEYFAEASPVVFLDKVFADISIESALCQVLKDYKSESEFRTSFQTVLFRILEKLAWHREYFGRVVEILLIFQKLKISANQATVVQDLLNNLFRTWLPSTELSLKERFNLLAKSSIVNQRAVLEIGISLLPKRYALSGVRTRFPKWRKLKKTLDSSNKDEIEQSHVEAKKLVIGMEQYSFEEIQLLLENLIDFGEEYLDKLDEVIKKWSKVERDDVQREKVFQSLQKSITALKFLKIENKARFWEKIDAMMLRVQPKLAVFRFKWLFDKKIIDWTLLVENEIETRPDKKEHEELLENRRIHAINEILSDGEEDAILDLLSKVAYPSIVSESLFRSNAEVERRAKWIEMVLEKTSEQAAIEFINQTLLGSNNEGTNIAKILNLLRNKSIFQQVEKRNLLVRALPSEPQTWKILETFDNKAKILYWQSFDSKQFGDKIDSEQFTRPESNEIENVVENLVRVKRSVDAFKVATKIHDEIGPSLWKEILISVIQDNSISKLDHDSEYFFNDIFKCLDEDANNSIKEIAELEFPLLAKFSAAERILEDRNLACHQFILKDINYFFELLTLCYNHGNRLEYISFIDITEENLNRCIDSANQILRSWHTIPGEDEFGSINQEQFKEWIESAYNRAQELNLLSALKHYLPWIFAKFANNFPWETTLPDIILDILNQEEDLRLREEFWVEVINNSGAFLGDLFEGGRRQREVAEKYNKLASTIESKFPRVAETLRKGTDQLIKEAAIEDERLKLRERDKDYGGKSFGAS